MIKFSVIVGFIVMVVPLYMIMVGIAIWTDAKAREVDFETDEDLLKSKGA